MTSFFNDADEQRQAQIVRDALRQWPQIEASPDFDARAFDNRVLEAIRRAPFQDAPPTHAWTRRERLRLWFAQHVAPNQTWLARAPRIVLVFGIVVMIILALLIFHALFGLSRNDVEMSKAPTPARSEAALQNFANKVAP